MTLPNFLGIGVMRGGTTWLHEALNSHPEIYVPSLRKEIHFFDENYEKGIEWYERFFPSDEESKQYSAIGEVTPKYLFDPKVPGRVKKHLPDCKFIILLRNPVERAYSQYTRQIRSKNIKYGFREFVKRYPDVFERGLYYKQLKTWFEYFPKRNFLILNFDDIKNTPHNILQRIADFFDVENNFYFKANEKVNKSFSPLFPRLYMMVAWIRKKLLKYNLDFIVKVANFLKIPSLVKLLRRKKQLPCLSEKDKEWLRDKYEESLRNLREFLGEDFSLWI